MSLAARSAHAQGYYAVTEGSNPALVALNANGSLAYTIGSLSGLPPATVLSLALSSNGQTLYAGTDTGRVYSINTQTAAISLINSAASQALYGLSFFNNQLYGVQSNGDGTESLVTLSTAGNGETILGTIADGGDPTDFIGLARGLTLYNGQLVTADAGIGGGGGFLYSLNPTTGNATPYNANAFFTLSSLSGLATYAPTGALVAYNDDPGVPNANPADLRLYGLNPSTGTATPLGTTGLRIAGIAFGASLSISAPEPATLPLLAAAAVPFVLVLNARRRRTEIAKEA